MNFLIFIKVFYKLYLIKREEVDNIIIFLFIIIKVKYDIKYLTLNLKEEDNIFLRLYYKYSFLNLLNKNFL